MDKLNALSEILLGLLVPTMELVDSVLQLLWKFGEHLDQTVNHDRCKRGGHHGLHWSHARQPGGDSARQPNANFASQLAHRVLGLSRFACVAPMSFATFAQRLFHRAELPLEALDFR